MTPINTNYDVKITIVRPYITKNITGNDLGRISETTTLKYEKLATQTVASQPTIETASDEQIMSYLDQSIADLDQLHADFDDLAAQAAKALQAIVFTYDITLQENESIANAERSLFGSASGAITFEKYQRICDMEDILNREIQERMVNNGGKLDVVA